MAEGDLIVKMMSQGEAQVYDSVMKLAAAWSKTDDATKKAGDEARKVGREDAQLTKDAARVRETLITNQERYNQKVAALDTLLKRGKLSQDEYTAAVAQTKEQHLGLEKSIFSALGPKVLGQLAAVAGGYLGIQSAVNAVTGALEHQRKRQQEALTSHLSAADAQAEALTNLSATSEAEQATITAGIEKMAAKTRPAGGVATAWKTFSAALSGAGGRPEEAMPATEAALRFSPVNAKTATDIAAVLPDLKAMTGRDAMSNLGYLTELGRLAVSTNQQQVSGYLAPAAKNLGAFGASPQEAGAMVTAIQKAMGQRDVEGRLTATASLQLAKQMEELLPEVAPPAKLDEMGMPIEGGKQPIKTGLKTVTERLRFLQTNKQAREKFLAEASFEAPSMVAVQELLGAREGRTKKYYEENLRDFAKPEDWAKLAEQRSAIIQKTRSQGIAGLERTATGLTEQLRAGPMNVESSIAGVLSKERADELLRAAGAGYVKTKTSDFAFTASELTGGEAEKRFAAILQREITGLERKEVPDIEAMSRFGAEGHVSKFVPETDPKRLQAAKVLREGLAQIQQRIKDIRESAAVEEKAASEPPAPAMLPAPGPTNMSPPRAFSPSELTKPIGAEDKSEKTPRLEPRPMGLEMEEAGPKIERRPMGLEFEESKPKLEPRPMGGVGERPQGAPQDSVLKEPADALRRAAESMEQAASDFRTGKQSPSLASPEVDR